MGGFARIPIIEQTVGLGYGRPALAPNVPPPAAAAFAGLAEGAQRVGDVLATQQRHQAIIDADQAEDTFKNAIQQSYAKAKVTLPGSQWAPTVEQEGAGIAQQMLDDPANAHIRGYLEKRLPQLLSQIKGDATISGMVATAKQQDDQFKGLQGKMAAQAGADFKVNPDGTFTDGPIAQAVRSKNESMIQALWGQNPDAAAQARQRFNDLSTIQRAQFIAQNQPQALDKYLAQQPTGRFTAEQVKGLNEIARTAIEQPYHDVMAAHEAHRGQVLQGLDTLAANHDPGLYTAAYTAAQSRFISPEEFQQYTNTKWRDPAAESRPGLVDSYKKQIESDPFSLSSADITGISSDDINPNDRRQLQAKLHDAQDAAKKPLGAAYIRARQQIREALAPGIVNINPERTRMRTEGALSDLESAYKAGDLKRVQDVNNITNAIISTYRVGPPKKPATHVTSPPIPPAVAAKIAAEARAKGFEPGGPSGSE